MNSKQYAELLKRPEWKARRLEILARDKNTCQSCGSNDELHVHHLRYLDGKYPWESPDKDLTTLCKSCHNSTHTANKNVEYAQMYLSDMNFVKMLETKSEIQVFLYLIKECDYTLTENDLGNPIIINVVITSKLSKVLGFNVGTIRNTIANLAKKGLLIKGKQRTLYYINPKYFFKGSSGSRMQAFSNIKILK